jgi:DNA polymerase III delta prime subunit
MIEKKKQKKKRKRKLSEITTLTDNFENINLKDKSVSELTQNVANLDLNPDFEPISFIEKYKPKKLKNFIGNSNLFELKKIKDWLKDWKPSSKNKGMLIFGPSGSGKTCLSHVVAKKYKYNVLELNSSDERNGKVMKKFKLLVETSSPFIKNLLLIDDVEISTGSDQGFIKYISDLLKVTQIPIILTCCDKYERKIKTIKKYCSSIELFHPKKKEVFNYLSSLLKKEGLEVDEDLINNLIKSSRCDIRYCLINLQFYSIPVPKEKKEGKEKINNKKKIAYNIFDGSNLLFNNKVDSDMKKDIIYSDKFMYGHWIEHNYITTSNNLEQVVNRSDRMSDVDLFEYNIRSNQNFNLIPYQVNLLENVTRNSKRRRIEFPQTLGKMSRIKSNREKINKLLPRGVKVEEFELVKRILYSPIITPTEEVYEKCLNFMIENNWTILDWKEQLFDKSNLNDIKMEKKEITKRKTKFVKFFNKRKN